MVIDLEKEGGVAIVEDRPAWCMAVLSWWSELRTWSAPAITANLQVGSDTWRKESVLNTRHRPQLSYTTQWPYIPGAAERRKPTWHIVHN